MFTVTEIALRIGAAIASVVAILYFYNYWMDDDE